MKRRLMGAMTILSLLLALAVGGLWGHSAVGLICCSYYSGPDSAGAYREWQVGSANGRIVWGRILYGRGTSAPRTGTYTRIYPRSNDDWPWLVGQTVDGLGIAGFYWAHRPRTGGSAEWWFVAVPDYFLLALLLVLPARWWLKRRGYPPNCCPACGYDLRATPDPDGPLLARCPECGQPAPAKTEAMSQH